jgi:uncharacterized protein YjbJ (UPF0337 family)
MNRASINGRDEGKFAMGIVFFCQSCGARFEVDARMAGKKGRCKKCGQAMAIPKAENLASMSAMPALAAAGVGAVSSPRPFSPGIARPGAAALDQSMGDWLKQSMSKIGLAPLSMAAIPKRPFAPSALDDAEDSKPYVMEAPDRRDAHGKGGGPPNVVLAAWRHEMGVIQRIFRWLNESAYVVSIPFVIILLFGIAVKSYAIAIFGATFVVLLNIGRIVAGVANLVFIPLRDGLNAKKYKKPLRRVIEPVVTIALVVVAFTFIPWLSKAKQSEGTITDRIRSTAESLKGEIQGEVGKVTEKAKGLDFNKLGDQAQSKLKGVVDQAQEKFKGLEPPSGEPTRAPAPGAAGAQPEEGSSVRELLKDVKRGSEALKELKKEP